MMNIRFEGDHVRVRLELVDARRLLEKGSLDASTRFPNGKRFRYGLRVAQVPAGEAAALPVVVSFTTEGGGFGADLVFVILRSDLERLISRAGSKSESIDGKFQTPDSGNLSVQIQIDSFSREITARE